MTKRKARPGSATRKSGVGGRSGVALTARIVALEERVARLESGRPPPGDGRRAAPDRKLVRRCPGCGLPLRQLRGRCVGCGRPVD